MRRPQGNTYCFDRWQSAIGHPSSVRGCSVPLFPFAFSLFPVPSCLFPFPSPVSSTKKAAEAAFFVSSHLEVYGGIALKVLAELVVVAGEDGI